MARPCSSRPCYRRPSCSRPAHSRPSGFKVSSASGLTASAASASINSGDGLPTADVITLTLTVNGDAGAISGSNKNLSAYLSGYAANRVLDFTNVSLAGSLNAIEIQNVAVSNTVVGNGTLTTGTPTAYATTDNKVTYLGGSSDLTGLNAFSNLSTSLTGDTVPVVCSFAYVTSPTQRWQIVTEFTHSLGFVGSPGQFYAIATGLKFEWANEGDWDFQASNLIGYSNWNSTSTWTATSALSDRVVNDGTGDFPAFTFPLYIVGGALAVPSSASQSGTTVTVNFSRSVNTGSTDTAEAWTTRKTNTGYEGSSGSYSGSALTLTVVSSGANVGADVLNYTGGDTGALDGASRPIPPITNFALS